MSGVNGQDAANGMSSESMQNSVEQQQQNAENKKQADALKGFQQLLQELP